MAKEFMMGAAILGMLLLSTYVPPAEMPEAPDQVDVVTHQPVIESIDGPQCPKFNADGLQLTRQFGAQSDGRDWVLECTYEEKS